MVREKSRRPAGESETLAGTGRPLHGQGAGAEFLLHPTLQQRDVQEANASLGVVTEAWSPLGRGADLEIADITTTASRVGATPAQVVLAWHLARGRVVIPKSVTPSRIEENLASVDVHLSDADLDALDALDAGTRIGPDPATYQG